MSNLTPLPEPSDVVGTRVREIRKRQGLTVEELADRCAVVGVPHLTANAVYLIEGGGRGKAGKRSRRRVTVEELLALSVALTVPPLVLLLPGDELDFAVTPEVTASAEKVFEWATGTQPLSADVVPEVLAAAGLPMDSDAAMPKYMRTGAADIQKAADLLQQAIGDIARAAAERKLIPEDVAARAIEIIQDAPSQTTEDQES